MSISSITSNMLGILDPLVSGQARRQAHASTVIQMEAGPQAGDVAALQQAFKQLSAFAPDNTGSITSGNTSSGAPNVGNPLHQGPLPPTYGHYLGGPPIKLPQATATNQQLHYVLPTQPDLQLIWSNAVAADAGTQFDLQA